MRTLFALPWVFAAATAFSQVTQEPVAHKAVGWTFFVVGAFFPVLSLITGIGTFLSRRRHKKYSSPAFVPFVGPIVLSMWVVSAHKPLWTIPLVWVCDVGTMAFLWVSPRLFSDLWQTSFFTRVAAFEGMEGLQSPVISIHSTGRYLMEKKWRRLSSKLTFFWKFIFPVLWIPGLGLLTLLTFTGSQWLRDFPVSPRDKWLFLASWVPGSFCIFWFPIILLKRVRMDGEFLYISNYLTEARVPLSDVWSVGVWAARPVSARRPEEVPVRPFTVVEFQRQTPFGNRIVFMARDAATSSWPQTHPVVTEIRQAVDQALLASTTPGESTPRDLGRAREAAARAAEARRVARPGKPTLRLQESYVRRRGLLWHLFGIPGGGFLLALVLAAQGAGVSSSNFARDRTWFAGASTAILIGFTLLLGAYFVSVLRFWLGAPARLVPYFERHLDAKSWGAFKRGFALVQSFDAVEARAAKLDVTPLSAFGFGDDLLGQVVVWHAADSCLKTVRALAASSQQEALDPKLVEDLRAVEAVLAKAEAADVRFAVVVRIGADDLISPHEMDCRKGSFW